MPTTFYTIDRHCDPNSTSPRSPSLRQQAGNTNSTDQPIVQQLSVSNQIERRLIKWEQLQRDNTRCLQSKQQQEDPQQKEQQLHQQQQQQQQQQQMEHFDNQKSEQSQLDDYDRIMEADLEYQLRELELEEKKQYELLKKSLEEQLKTDDSRESINELQRNYIKQIGHIKALQIFEANEQQQQYDTIMKKLEECEQEEQQWDSIKQLENNKHSLIKKPWKIFSPFACRGYQENPHHLLAKKRKQMLQLQLTLIQQNQMKTKQIIDLIESHWKNKEYYIPIPKPYYNCRP